MGLVIPCAPPELLGILLDLVEGVRSADDDPAPLDLLDDLVVPVRRRLLLLVDLGDLEDLADLGPKVTAPIPGRLPTASARHLQSISVARTSCVCNRGGEGDD